MIPEIGLICLLLSWSAAFLQGVCAFAKKPVGARCFGMSSAFLTFISLLILIFVFAQDDFTVRITAEHSHSHLPFAYKLAAIWSSTPGSVLLFACIINLWNLAFILRAPKHSALNDVFNSALGWLGLILFAVLSISLWVANPFARFFPDFPIEGLDLNPLLQDPAMVIHPPILYAGFAGFVIPFVAAAGACFHQYGQAQLWAKWIRPWGLAAFSFLTLGIALGSGWAYYTLGWGGFWYWDPVENASLLPWILAVGWIHLVRSCASQNKLYGATLFFSFGIFLLVLLGIFLVRSGAVQSVHAFAQNAVMGQSWLALWIILVMVSTVALLKLPRQTFLLTRSVMTYQALAIFLAMLLVLAGTLYPVLYGFWVGQTFSLAPQYYHIVFQIWIIPFVLLMIYGQQCTLRLKVILSVLSITLIMVLGWFYLDYVRSLIGLVLGGATLVSLCLGNVYKQSTRLKQATLLCAHGGFVLMLLGVVLVSDLGVEKELAMKPGQVAQVGPYQIEFNRIQLTTADNYIAEQALFEIKAGHTHIATLSPEKRFYFLPEVSTANTAILKRHFSDLLIVLSDKIEETLFAVRLHYKPFIRLIWIGMGLMSLAGLLSLFSFRQQRG